MYAKLAARNMKRSVKNYLIYFITVTLTVTLMYSFLSLGFSKDILSMSENMAMLTTAISLLSVLVALASSMVIGYAISYMLGQRKKEFGTYKLLGMEIKTIRRLFLLENILIGIAAFSIGIIAGSALSGVLAQVVKNIFSAPHTYRIIFSPAALLVSLLLFLLMYGVGMINAARIIRRRKIVDLLYDSQKNEEAPKRSTFSRISVVCISTAAAFAGLYSVRRGIAVQTNAAWFYIAASAVLLCSGIYGLYRNIPYMLVMAAKRNARIKYANANLFYFGQISRRIQSCGRLMAVTAILLTVSLAAMFIGMAMGGGYKANIQNEYPYDVGVAIDAPFTKDSFSPLVSFVGDRCTVTDSLCFYLYSAEDYLIDVLAFSDYAHLRSILALPAVKLEDKEYIVHCDTWAYQEKIEAALAERPAITLAGHTLENPQGVIYTEPMGQYQLAGTGGYVLVVPDAAAEALPADKVRIVMQLENGGYPELRAEIRQFLNNESTGRNLQLQNGAALPEKITLGVTVKAWGTANSLTGFTTISFCGLYLSIVFILLSCTILAFEQLSAIDSNKRSYRIIDKMGVSKQTQRRLVRQELATFFFIPLVLPVTVTLLLIFGAQNLFGEAILQEGMIPLCGAITLILFFIIYFIYYQGTAYLFKKNIGVL